MPFDITFVRVRIVAYITLTPYYCVHHKESHMPIYIAFVRVRIVAYITLAQ